MRGQITEVTPEIEQSVKVSFGFFYIPFHFDRHQTGTHLHQICAILTRRYRHLGGTVAPNCVMQDTPLIK